MVSYTVLSVCSPVHSDFQGTTCLLSLRQKARDSGEPLAVGAQGQKNCQTETLVPSPSSPFFGSLSWFHWFRDAIFLDFKCLCHSYSSDTALWGKVTSEQVWESAGEGAGERRGRASVFKFSFQIFQAERKYGFSLLNMSLWDLGPPMGWSRNMKEWRKKQNLGRDSFHPLYCMFLFQEPKAMLLESKNILFTTNKMWNIWKIQKYKTTSSYFRNCSH